MKYEIHSWLSWLCENKVQNNLRALTVERNRADANDSDIISSGRRRPVGVTDDVSGYDAVTTGEQSVGAEDNGEGVSRYRTVVITVSSSHDAVVGNERTTAHGLEDDHNLNDETSLVK